MDRLPSDIAAERIVLASILEDNNILADILDVLTVKDFYKSQHAYMYTTFIKMFTLDIPIEVESVFNYLGEERVKAVGGITYLSQLTLTELTSNCLFYASIVKEKAHKRLIIQECQKAIQKAYNTDTTDSIIEDIENSFIAMNSKNDKEKTVDTSELMDSTITEIERKYAIAGDIAGIQTGFAHLDRATNGYQVGDLWIVAARPSMGKTLLVLNLLSNLKKDKKAIIFEMEMTKEKLGNRMLSARSKVNSKILARGKLNENEFEKVIKYSSEIAQDNNIFINCKSAITLAYIRAECKKLKIRNGLDVVFIDHLGLLKSVSKSGNRSIELGEITSGLKAIAKDLDVCIVCLSQLSRAVEQRNDKHPMLSDLRESGRIEEDADTVMFLYRDDYYAERENRESENSDTLEIFIAKNRDGEIGGIELRCDLKNQSLESKFN